MEREFSFDTLMAAAMAHKAEAAGATKGPSRR